MRKVDGADLYALPGAQLIAVPALHDCRLRVSPGVKGSQCRREHGVLVSGRMSIASGAKFLSCNAAILGDLIDLRKDLSYL